MDPLTIASMGLGALGGIGKFLFGNKQDQYANQINPNYIPYQANPLAKENLTLTQNLFNGRMPGSAEMEGNIGTSQANTVANIMRNAPDSATALALASGAQGTSNQAYSDLQTKEASTKYSLLDNLNNAYAANIREGDKVYQDRMRKFEIDSAAKAGLRSSGAQNMFGGIGDLASLGIMAGQYGGWGKPKPQYNDYGFNNFPANYLNTGG